MSREFTYIKRDGIERKLVGKIVSRLEDAGFKIARMKKGTISDKLALSLYEDSEEQLRGMGNKTLESTKAKGGDKLVKEIFNTLDPIEIGKQLNSWNRAYATSADVIAMVLEGDDAPARVRKLIGKTDPSLAEKGTIRGDFANDSIYQGNTERRACKNLVHASDPARAETEIKLFEDNFF